jgi:hypothetical protein
LFRALFLPWLGAWPRSEGNGSEASSANGASRSGITEDGTMTFDDQGHAEGTLNLKGDTTGKEIEASVIVDGTKAYMSSDALDSLPEGKKWMGLDYSKAVKGAATASPAEGSPVEGLKVLEKVEGAEEVGKQEIEGVSTTHYRGDFPLTDEIFGVKTHFSAPRADVWIDSQDQVRRMKVVVTGSLNEGEGKTTTEEETTFAEFGRVPKIEAPPQSEVFDATGEIESQVQEAANGG